MSKKELDHLYLTKNERMGILILFFLLFVLIMLPWLYFKSDPLIFKADRKEDLFINKPREHSKDSFLPVPANFAEPTTHSNPSKSEPTMNLFEFDPNFLDANDAKRLGITEKSYRILQKYLGTGAKIKTPEQLSKIYGIDEATFRKLRPFIKIKEAEKQLSTQKVVKVKSIAIVNLNTAEPDDLIPLPGIGEKLATRIIKYRNLLGGFSDVSQLNEIYGLQDSVIRKFRNLITINGSVNKIKLNKIEYEDLKKHPYIGPQKARVICEYKKQHHGIKEMNDLYKIAALDSSWIRRISEYLSFE